MPSIFVGIGSNQDREANVRGAVQHLRESFDELRVSPVYQCPAYGFGGGDFYNLVAGFTTGLSLDALLAEMKSLEQLFGRRRNRRRFTSRKLDIDLLLYGTLQDAQRDVPRSDILRYYFVLKPLADLAPELHHPVTGRTLSEHWASFDKAGVELHDIHIRL